MSAGLAAVALLAGLMAGRAQAQERRTRIRVDSYVIDADINQRTQSLAAKAELASALHDVKTSIDTYGLILAQMTDNGQKVGVTDQMGVVYAREKQDTDADAMFRKAISDYGDLPAETRGSSSQASANPMNVTFTGT